MRLIMNKENIMYRYFLASLFIAPLLFAEVSSQISIDAEIHAIKNAAPSERVKLMNAFKIRVSQMNQQERSNAIATIQKYMYKDSHTQNRPHTSQMQMKESTSLNHYQNINQHQAGDRVPHSSRIETTPHHNKR
jgi:hypothetical protein